jgi:hypothetical protein
MGRRAKAVGTSDFSSVFLWADKSDLFSPSLNGYRIIFGNGSANVPIRLHRYDSGTTTTIFTSTVTVPSGLTDYGFMVKVTRTSAGLWSVYTSTLPTTSGTGAVATDATRGSNITISAGAPVTDTTYTNFDNGYIGVYALHNSDIDALTAAEFDDFRFDTQADSPLPVQLMNFTAR